MVAISITICYNKAIMDTDKSMRTYEVVKPASEAELGRELRATALAAKTLNVIVRDGDIERQFVVSNYSLSVGNSTEPPSIVGMINELIAGDSYNAGAGRIDVVDGNNDDESARGLELTVTALPQDPGGADVDLDI